MISNESRRPRPVRRTPTVLVILAATLATACLAPAHAGATTYALPLTSYGDIQLDEAHSQLFVTGSNSIVVRKLDGTVKSTIAEVSPGGMVLDGNTLYVARCGSNAIAKYDTATLALLGTISLASYAPAGSQGNPGRACTLAKAGGRLWISTSDTWGSIVSVNLSTGTTASFLSNGYYGAIIAADPSRTNRLVIADGSSSPPYYGIYDIDGAGTPVLVGTKHRDGAAASVNDIRFTPDGSSLLVANGSPYNVRKLDASTKSVQTTWTTGAYPEGVTMSTSGSWLAATRNASYDYDAYVFPAAGGGAVNRYEFGASQTAAAGGVELSSNASRLYAVSYTYSPATISLHVFDSPTTATAATTITAPATASATSTITVSGALAVSGDASVIGRTVQLAALAPGGAVTSLGSATTTTGGAWTSTIPAGTLAGAASWTLRATADAFAPFPSAVATRSIAITSSSTSTLGLTVPASTLRGNGATISGTLAYSPAASAVGRLVTVLAAAPGRAAAPVGTMLTTSGGAWSLAIDAASLDEAGSWTIQASVAANGGYPSASISRALLVYPPIPPPTVIPDIPRVPVVPAPPIVPPTDQGGDETQPADPTPPRTTRGADRITGTAGNDLFRGMTGNDQLRGGDGNDRLYGDAGNDRLFGDAGNDRLYGGAGNDRLVGGAGRDMLDGGPGNDTIDANDHAGGDNVRCGSGRDTVIANRGDRIARDCERVLLRR